MLGAFVQVVAVEAGGELDTVVVGLDHLNVEGQALDDVVVEELDGGLF